MKDDGGGLAPIFPATGRHDALLVVQRLPHFDEAVLEDGGRVAKDEVDGAGDGAIPVELTLGMAIERVLEPIHLAVVEDRFIGLHPHGNGLVFLWTGRVFKPKVLGNEPVSDRSFIATKLVRLL